MTESREGSENGQPMEVNRHDSKIMEGIENAPIYKKQGEVKAAIAQGGEVVETKLADGTVETRNTANPGDAIITNPGGEQYIIDAVKFGKRYEPKMAEDGKVQEGVFAARGYCKAIDNPFGSPITMMASWGEMQNGGRDAKIADTYDFETRTLGGEPYIIGRSEFVQTYKPVDTKPTGRVNK
jgi:hypothetical protein